ncbi:putative mannosyltransferase KTR2 [Candida viswanathii]|uniref:Putative mannosyltransferase KTR2 n=1 Tax=Candida viswanathii TaxID=5486 RepID=A0A367YPG4_9ASCO|nr:putative mannosyltransferase KTR2 [Candida viswanathii]
MNKCLSILLIGSLLSIYYYYVLNHLNSTSQPPYNPLANHQPKLAGNQYLSKRFPYENKKQIGKENATMVMLVRNVELKGALESIRSLEDRFNKYYKYPWVFLNDVPFDDEFIEQTSLMASGATYYELIPEDDWQPPPFINQTKLTENLINSRHSVLYGGVRSYRNMCHFNSGFFYKQKRLLNYDWYFRVEPDVEYMCDFQYDPFELLRVNNKVYGFIIAIMEYENTIPSLWPTVESFMKEYPELLHPNNALDFITTNETSLNHYMDMIPSSTDYNLCHFWSNFEIGNLNFFRNQSYETFFDYLSRSGGFYYERWGDAPVHTIGLSLLADKNAIHHFEDIGYYHAPYLSCPSARDVLSSKRCVCQPRQAEKEVNRTIDTNVYSCLPRWWKYGSGKRFLNEIDYQRQ